MGLWHRKFYNLLLYRPSFVSRLSRDIQWVRSLMPETGSGSQVSSGHQHRPLSLRLYRTWAQIRRERDSPGPHAPSLLCTSLNLFSRTNHFSKFTAIDLPKEPRLQPSACWPLNHPRPCLAKAPRGLRGGQTPHSEPREQGNLHLSRVSPLFSHVMGANPWF